MNRAYRIERFLEPSIETTPPEDLQAQCHNEVMKKLQEIQDTIQQGVTVQANNTIDLNEEKPSPLQGNCQNEDKNHDENNEIIRKKAELIKLKFEMGEIYKAINETKTQILTIKESGAEGHEMARAAEELSMIVRGTEDATNTILQSAETIESNSVNLIAAIQDESQQAMACEIQEQVVGIFEACNFQDLTGQRITKVVKTFCFIEQRILKMVEIWGGPDNFEDITAEELDHRKGDGSLLNGPTLQGEDSIANQDDIDALFD